MTRQALKGHIARTFGIDPEQPWADDPQSWVFRRRDNQKWFALVMNLPLSRLGLAGDGRGDFLNLKLPPETVDFLRQSEGYFPAYHMNKTHWITLRLEGPLEAETICRLVSASYDQAAGQSGRPKNPPQFSC